MMQFKKGVALLLALTYMVLPLPGSLAAVRPTDWGALESDHFLFEPELVTTRLSPDKLQQFFSMLDAAYEAGTELTGNAPKDGGQILIAYDALGSLEGAECFTSRVGGDTLFLSSASFGELLQKYEAEDKVSFSLFHQLGHCFAMDSHLEFHSELFADLVGMYMVIRTGANVYQNITDGTEAEDYIEGTGVDFVQKRLACQTEYALARPNPGNLLWLLFSPLLEAYGYQPFQSAFLYFTRGQTDGFIPAAYENEGEPNGIGDAAQAHTFMDVLSHFTPNGMLSVAPSELWARFAQEWRVKGAQDGSASTGRGDALSTAPGSHTAPGSVALTPPPKGASQTSAAPHHESTPPSWTPAPQATATPRGVTGVHETAWGTMESDHFIFLPDVVKENLSPENIQKFFGLLDAAYEAGVKLLGNGPGNKGQINITHNFENTGLPEGFYSSVGGNTLWLSATGFGELLRAFEEEGKIDFRLFHELGHSFTLDPRLGLSNELFAHFVGMYMVQETQADVYSDVDYWDGRGTRIEGVGAEFSDKRLAYETEWAHGEPDPSNLLWLIYGPVLDAYGYQPFQDAFRYFTQGETDGFTPSTYVNTDEENGVGSAMLAHAFMEVLSHFTPGGLESVVPADVLSRFATEWRAKKVPITYFSFDVGGDFPVDAAEEHTATPSSALLVPPAETPPKATPALSCGIPGHSAGDGFFHNQAYCGKSGHFDCDGSDHMNRCGLPDHSMCDGKNHSAPSCGFISHYTCDGKNHTPASCGIAGHLNCDNNQHGQASCGISGHFTCQGGSQHIPASCGKPGHYGCDNAYHGSEACGIPGHTNCDGQNHNNGSCGISGHTECDGRSHNRASCGISGHAVCDGGNHSSAGCGMPGHTLCDGQNHDGCNQEMDIPLMNLQNEE